MLAIKKLDGTETAITMTELAYDWRVAGALLVKVRDAEIWYKFFKALMSLSNDFLNLLAEPRAITEACVSALEGK
jgi:hypothetical protein